LPHVLACACGLDQQVSRPCLASLCTQTTQLHWRSSLSTSAAKSSARRIRWAHTTLPFPSDTFASSRATRAHDQDTRMDWADKNVVHLLHRFALSLGERKGLGERHACVIIRYVSRSVHACSAAGPDLPIISHPLHVTQQIAASHEANTRRELNALSEC
jgi:hypothetical protein